MSRTNIDIDDELVGRVMSLYRLPTKRAAVDYALRKVAIVPMTRDEILAMEGYGWDGDLDEMRAGTGLHKWDDDGVDGSVDSGADGRADESHHRESASL